MDDSVIEAVRKEVHRAVKKHGAFNSAHEAYGVLLEEVDEFWEEVRKKRSQRSKKQMRAELIQIAAVAIKAIKSLCDSDPS